MVSPSQVPAMVAAHQDCLRTLAYEEFAGYFFRSMYAKDTTYQYEDMAKMVGESVYNMSMGHGEEWAQRERNTLNISALFHVTEPMLAVAVHAAEKLHDDDRWGADILPSPNGFMVFEKALRITDVWGRVTGVCAVSWRRDRIAQSVDPKLPAETLFTFYTDTKDVDDFYNKDIDFTEGPNAQLGRWVMQHHGAAFDTTPIGPMINPDGPERIRAYREKNAEIDETLHKDSPAMALAQRFLHPEDYDRDGKPLGPDDPMPEADTSSENQFRIMYSIFILMQQSLAVLTEETDRKLARRIKNKRRPPPMVTVIRLRREEQFGYRDQSTGGWLTYRSLTRSHYRRQHYGDGTVKRIFIAAYWRGDPDLPIWQPKRVTSLQR